MGKLLVFGLVCVLAADAGAQWLEKTVWLPDSMPYINGSSIVAFNPDNHRAYVGGGETQYLQILDYASRQKVRRIEILDVVNGMLCCPDRHRLYLLSKDLGGLYVLDDRGDSLLGVVELEEDPLVGVYNPVAHKAYIGTADHPAVWVLDPGPDTVLTSIRIYDEMVATAYDSAANRVFFLGAEGRRDSGLYVIDCLADTVSAKLPTPDGYCLDMEWDPQTRRLYCLGNSAVRRRPEVWVYDPDSLAVVASVALPESWYEMEGGLLLNPVSGYLYAYWAFPCRRTDRYYLDDSIAVIDCAANVLHGYVEMPEGSEIAGLSLNPADSKVYVSSRELDSVAVLGKPDSITGWIRTALPSWCVAWNPDGNEVVIPGGDNVLYFASGTTDSIVARVDYRPFSAEGMAWAPAGSKLYAVGNDGLAVIGPDNNVLRIHWRRLWNQYLAPGYVAELNRLYFYGVKYEARLVVYDCNTDSIVAEKWVPGGVQSSPFVVPGRHKLYLSSYDGDAAVYDVYRDTTLKVIPRAGYSFCHNPRTGMVYGSAGRVRGIKVIDPALDSIVAVIPCPDRNPAANSADNELYTTSQDTLVRRVYISDCRTNMLSDSIDVPGHPVALAWYGPLNKLYAVCDTWLVAIDCRSRSIVKAIPLHWPVGQPHLVFSYRNDRLWVGRIRGVAVVQCRVDSLVADISGTAVFSEMVWNQIDNRIYGATPYRNCIYVYRDDMTGIEEMPSVEVRTTNAGPSIVRGVLRMGDRIPNTGYRAELMDAAGRKVADLVPGENDVRHLAPGICFVRSRPSAVSGEPLAVRKVVVTR